MNYIDRLLIGALVLGVWASVAIQFFDGVTVEAAAAQIERSGSISQPVYVEIRNSPLRVECQ